MEIVKAFSIEEVYLQTQRVLNHPSFVGSPTLSKFLKFVVSETVHGRDLHIKEYSIAVNVLNRPNDFNPHEDDVVRIHAGRLRRALNEYYYTMGINDTLIITIPKGTYVPKFIAAEKIKPTTLFVPVLPVPAIDPVLAVFPFRIIPQRQGIDEFSRVLGEQLSAELSRFQDISVIGYYSMEMMAKIEENILEAGKSMGADYILAGSIQYSGNHMRIRVNLLITATGEVLMTKSFDRDLLLSSIFSIQDEIIPEIIGALGGYYGLLFQEMAKTSPLKASGNARIRLGVSGYYSYKRSFTVESFNLALSALGEAVTEYPDHAASWAMLGELYLDGIGLGIKTIEDPLTESYQCVIRSLTIDPLCQHAWHTLTGVQLYRREKEACLQSARRCIELNPNCSVLVSGVAVMLICAGWFEEGYPIMEKTIKFNPYSPWWINVGFCFFYLNKKDYPSALFWIEKMNSEQAYLDPLLKAVSLSYLNKMKAAEKYLARLLGLEPEAPTKIREMLSTFVLSEELIAQIITGLEKIGLRLTQDCQKQ